MPVTIFKPQGNISGLALGDAAANGQVTFGSNTGGSVILTISNPTSTLGQTFIPLIVCTGGTTNATGTLTVSPSSAGAVNTPYWSQILTTPSSIQQMPAFLWDNVTLTLTLTNPAAVTTTLAVYYLQGANV